MANNNYDPKLLRGISIYQDGKRTLYAPFYTKKAYILTEKNAAHYINYIVGYLAALVIFEVVLIFSKNTLLSLIIAILTLIINYLYFYFRCLSKAGQVTDFHKVKENEPFIQRQANQLEYDRIYTLIICCILLVVILAFYMMWQKPEGIFFYITLGTIILSALYGFINFAIYLTKRKNDRKN